MKVPTALALAALVTAGCVGGGQPALSYFESVRQSLGCGGALCFDEVLALEDGLVYMKQGNASGYWVSFCNADGQKLYALFSMLDAQLEGKTLVDCRDCGTYHLFYNSGSETRYLSVPTGQNDLEGFHGKAKEVCLSNADAGLIHVIWGVNGEYTDYHIFSNDVVVYERFGLREGELLDSRAYRSEGVFARLTSIVHDDFFESNTKDNCPKDGLFYGFVEAAVGHRHREYFTCGDDTPAGGAFTALKDEVGGLS